LCPTFGSDGRVNLSLDRPVAGFQWLNFRHV
jgi:hypothetical protein